MNIAILNLLNSILYILNSSNLKDRDPNLYHYLKDYTCLMKQRLEQ